MKTWYQINNAANRPEVMIYEQIGKAWDGSGIGAKDFVSDLQKITAPEILVSINSPGGNVFDGLAIHNSLKAHRARVIVRVDGVAASIASVIAMAGDAVEMPENAMLMIHNPYAYCAGEAEDMRKQAEALDKVKLSLVGAYRNKSRQPDSEIAAMMSATTWLTAAEAVDLGFADKLLPPVVAQASNCTLAMLRRYRNCPTNLFTNQTRTHHTMANQTSNTSTNATDLQLRAEWERDADLRAEFMDDFQIFKSFKDAEAAGQIRIAGRGNNRESVSVNWGARS